MGIIDYLFAMVITGVIIIYLIRLETIGCKCAMDFKRNYLIYFHTFEILFYGAILLSQGKLLEYLLNSRYVIPIFSVIGTASLVNIIFSLLYIGEIAVKKCKCAQSNVGLMMFVLNALYLLIIIGTSLSMLAGYAIKLAIDT